MKLATIGKHLVGFFFSNDTHFLPRLQILSGYLEKMTELLCLTIEKKTKTERNILNTNIELYGKKLQTESRQIISELENNFLTEISREDILAITKITEKTSEQIIEACLSFETSAINLSQHNFFHSLCSAILDSTSSICICFKHLQKPLNKTLLKSSSDKIQLHNKNAGRAAKALKAEIFSAEIPAIQQIKLNHCLELLEGVIEQCNEMHYKIESILAKK